MVTVSAARRHLDVLDHGQLGHAVGGARRARLAARAPAARPARRRTAVPSQSVSSSRPKPSQSSSPPPEHVFSLAATGMQRGPGAAAGAGAAAAVHLTHDVVRATIRPAAAPPVNPGSGKPCASSSRPLCVASQGKVTVARTTVDRRQRPSAERATSVACLPAGNRRWYACRSARAPSSRPRWPRVTARPYSARSRLFASPEVPALLHRRPRRAEQAVEVAQRFGVTPDARAQLGPGQQLLGAQASP
jgi:hypothetical protein